MRLTTKGQVTIPQEIRNALGLQPGTRVDFDIVGNSVRIRKAAEQGRGAALVDRMREAARRAAGPRMTTDEILALTRGE
jgi:AbrB family looped-hinge helix DNA binding protein